MVRLASRNIGATIHVRLDWDGRSRLLLRLPTDGRCTSAANVILLPLSRMAALEHEAYDGETMAGYVDFRDFLATLEKEGQLLRITDQVRLEPDLAAAACALTQLGETSPAIQFENIAGFTGLGYVVNESGVYIWNQSSSTASGAGTREPAIGLIPLDNGMQIIVPQSQIPPDMQDYIRARTQRELEKIRVMMKEEDFKPSTRPTTVPR